MPSPTPNPVQPLDFRFECPRCGHGIVNSEARRCVECGQKLAGADDDRPNPLLMALGFLLPPVGLMVFAALRSRAPRKAMSAAQGAIWSPLLYLLIVPYLAGIGFFTPLIHVLTR